MWGCLTLENERILRFTVLVSTMLFPVLNLLGFHFYPKWVESFVFLKCFIVVLWYNQNHLVKEQWTFKIEFKLSCESLDRGFCFNGGNKGAGGKENIWFCSKCMHSKKKKQRVFLPNNTALNSSGLKFCLQIIFKENMQIKQFCPYKFIIY